ncbi:MAG TPA: DUF3892 domain-containing protein [Syntrophomonadaceae bacterium]|nr:DUF3892 domain-containing protein [Syntrophomonadaceae bacterium]
MEQLFIVEITKNGGGTQFKLSNGEVHNYDSIMSMVEDRKIRNVEIHQSDDGTKQLYYDPDTLQANDLYNVPSKNYDHQPDFE